MVTFHGEQRMLVMAQAELGATELEAERVGSV